jgi:hypothetical protein
VTLTASSRAGYAWALEKRLRELLDEPLVSIECRAWPATKG